MRLFPRLLIIFLTLIVIPLSFVATLVFTNASAHIEASMVHSLEAIADFRKASIDSFVADQRRRLEDLQGHWLIESKLPILSRHLGDQSSPSFIEATEALDKHFEQFQEHHDHNAVLMFDAEGRMVYSDQEEHRGMLGLRPMGQMLQSWEQGKKGVFFGPMIGHGENGGSRLWASVPIAARGRLLGVVAHRINLSEVVAKLNTRTGLGETGEILAGFVQDEEVILVNSFRHDPVASSLPSRRAALPLVAAAFGEDGAGISRDYRNHEVLAVWRYVPSLNWGMVAKIDVEEALHTVYELRQIALLIGLIALAFGILMAWVMARPLAAAVQQLMHGARMIGSGDLDYRLEIPDQGEFSELADSFNQMAGEMQQATDERIRILADLQSSEDRFRTMVGNVTGVVYRRTNDEGWTMEFISDGIEELSGYPASDFFGKRGYVDIVHPDDLEFVRREIDAAVGKREPYSLKYRIIDTVGKSCWVMERGQSVFAEGGAMFLDGVIIDISEQVRAEDELHAAYERLKNTQKASMNIMEDLERQRDALRQALEEREVLLREIHHRVKNNMQVISAMLELQGRYSNDSRAQEFFKDSQARIQSMALVHEKLYRLESLSRIDFGNYLRDLLDHIMNQYPGVVEREAVHIDVEQIMLPIDKAIPCGLIVNELITNTFKYAFPDKRQGRIDIAMHEQEGGAIILTVKDNGIGLPAGLDIAAGKTFGMYIVHSLVERQLAGSIEMNNEHGASFVIRFNKGSNDE